MDGFLRTVFIFIVSHLLLSFWEHVLNTCPQTGEERPAAAPAHDASTKESPPPSKIIIPCLYRRSHTFLTSITIMKLAILLSTLAVAAGFAPQSQPRQMTSLAMSDDLISGTVKW